MDVPSSLIEKSLSNSLEHEIRLAKCTKFKKNRIFRCWIADGPSYLPEVLLVKMARQTKHELYDRKRDCIGSSAWKLFNEWAALQFLGEINDDKMIAPRFIAGDTIQGLIAFEYMPKARSFRDILRNSDAAERTHALLAHAQAMGRMHGSTYGRKNKWLNLRTSLSTHYQAETDSFDGILRTFRRFATLVDQPESIAVESELSELQETLSNAEPFSAFRHVDIAPQNYLLVDDGVKLVDFEYSSYGYFPLDAPLGPFPFPVRWECDEVSTQEIESVYRTELSSGFRGALDDATYYKGILIAWIYWLLRLGPIPRTRADMIEVSDELARRCKAVARLSHQIEYLPQIGRTFEQVATIHASH